MTSLAAFERALCIEVRPDPRTDGAFRRRLAFDPNKLWDVDVLRVQFLGASDNVAARILATAATWTPHCNVRFQAVTQGTAELRISVYPGGSWSYIGTDAETATGATMNIGCGDDASDEHWRRAVLHEFGHALGCIHEHQSPSAGIKWRRRAVYDYYNARGWSNEHVDRSVFGRYEGTVSNSAFDPTSIMIYPIAAEWTEDGFYTNWNTELSLADQSFIAAAYRDRRAH